MNHLKYISDRVRNIEIRSRILSEVKDYKEAYGSDWLPDYINNFHWKLPYLRDLIEEKIANGKVDPKKKHRDYGCFGRASEQFLNQNLEGYLQDINEAIKRLGISPEKLKEKIEEDIKNGSSAAADEIFMVMVELMSWGYFRSPDLSQ